MKKLKSLLIMIAAMSAMMITMIFTVSADETTDLSDLKVYAIDNSGNQTEVPLDFNSTTYEYNLTVKSTVKSIKIEATAKDSTSQWSVEKDGINTIMDRGEKLKIVDVTSSTGAVQKYTLNTKKLTEAEDATYKEPSSKKKKTSKKTATDSTVKVGKNTFTISESFKKSEIPEGFSKSTAKYNGNSYTCIKGDVKELTAFYLKGDETPGFYIYDKSQKKFYPMSNIKIKSRMYTIVQPKKVDGIVKAYDKKKVTIIDQEVKAWVLDEDEGMYLVYAMNWNGDTNLYSYDDNEKCFQRYLTSSDANQQSEAAAKAYNNLQKQYNQLVDKYNVLIKVLCGLAVVIIILIFVSINLGISKKEKKIKKTYSEDELKDPKKEKKAQKKAEKKAKKENKKKKYEEDEDDIDSGVSIEEEEAEAKKVAEPSKEEVKEAPEEVEELKEVDIDSDELVDIEKALEAEIANEVAKKIDEPVEELPNDNTITTDAEQINDSAENSAEEVNKSEEIDAYDYSEIDFDDDDDDDDFEFIDLD